MTYLSIFRSCARKEYADQVIKMLRAVEGELTRTTYRLDWVTHEAFKVLNNESNALCVASLTDRSGTHGLPSRVMTVVQHEIDRDTGTLKLVFEMGPFVKLEEDFIGNLRAWGDDVDNLPPKKFVTAYQESWPSFREATDTEMLDSWRRSIDFVTTSWDFRNSVFLRPADVKLQGHEKEIAISVEQATRYEFKIASYNPHLTDIDLSLKTLNVANSGAIADIERCPPIDRDGIMSINLKFLEIGSSKIQINILPDPQFSTYIPIGFDVLSDLQSDPIGPRLLGPAWSLCLDEIGEVFQNDNKNHLEILKSLSIAFPNEPEAMLRRGLIHLHIGQTSIARDLFKEVLKIRESARGVAWLLAASLKGGDVNEAESLIQRLNLSNNLLFEQIVEFTKEIDEDTAVRFIDFPALYLSEDKAIQFVEALSCAVRSQDAVRKILSTLIELDKNKAFRFAAKKLLMNPEWRSLRRDYVQLADQLGMIEGVKDDINLILRFRNEKPEEIIDRVNRLGELVHPYELLGILLFNASQFFSQEGDSFRNAGLDQAAKAAQLAFTISDFGAADIAIQHVFNNAEANDSVSQAFSNAVAQIANKIAEMRAIQIDQVQKSDSYTDYLLSKLMLYTKDKTLVVFSRQGVFPYQEHWRSRLELRDFLWESESGFSEMNGNFLLEFDPNSLVVVIVWGASTLSKTATDWLEENGVSVARAFEGSESILHAMARVLEPIGLVTNDLEVQTPSEALLLAQKNLTNLQFNPAIVKIITELDPYPLATAWAKKIYKSLFVLNEYAKWRSGDKAGGEDFYLWLSKRDLLPLKWVTMKESETVGQNPKYRNPRTFPVDREVDTSGQKFMEPHIKISNNPPGPRIHFFDASDLDVKKVLIGYIGPHLPTPEKR